MQLVRRIGLQLAVEENQGEHLARVRQYRAPALDPIEEDLKACAPAKHLQSAHFEDFDGLRLRGWRSHAVPDREIGSLEWRGRVGSNLGRGI